MRSFALALALLAGCAADPYDNRPDLPPLASGKLDDYAQTGVRCGGWPRVSIDTDEALCVGVVAGSDDRLFKPRALLELPGRPYELLVTDLAGWRPGSGRVWYLDARTPPSATLTPVLEGLSLPHQITLGPEGWIYVGEDTRITAFPPEAVGPDGAIDDAQIVTVLDGLPPMDRDGSRNSFHPLTMFVFDEAGHLYVNVGAYSDHCAGFVGRECWETDGILDSGDGSARAGDWGAVIRRYDYEGSIEAGWTASYRVVAYGLRNSMGLAFAPSGDLLQVENSRDFRESDRPYEELNVIPRAELDGEVAAHHYGWPYCYDVYSTSDEWAGYDFRCSPDNPDYRPPHILLPPHGAPLGLTYYHGELLDELEGRLLVPLHGYRPAGQRLLAFDVDPNGLPIRTEGATYLVNPTGAGTSEAVPYPSFAEGTFAAQGDYLVEAWYEVDGVRPKGAPVAPYVGSDGTLWIADDKNRSILMIGRAQGALPPVQRVDLYPAYRRALNEDPELRGLYDAMVDGVLRSPQCSGCHDDFRFVDDDAQYPELRYLVSLGNWIRPGAPEDSILYTKLQPLGGADMPPPGREWPTTEDGQAALDAIGAFIRALPDVTPAFNEGWIGGPCTTDDDCDYDGARCFTGSGPGFCTLACTLERPYCPDRTGNATTFCVELADGSGGCVAQCDASDAICLDGQGCESRARFGQTREAHVCQ